MGSDQAYNVIIAGAGPAGLLTAHCLLARNLIRDGDPKWIVSVFESRGDPRLSSVGPRAYSLGLNIRGRTAITVIDRKYASVGSKMWQRIAEKGVESDQFFLHIGRTKIQLRQNSNDTVPTLLTSRSDLCASMLDELQALHSSHTLKLNFNTPLVDVNLTNRTCTFVPQDLTEGSSITVPYDLLVGADGVSSVVRAAMCVQGENIVSEEVTLKGEYKVALQEMPSQLEKTAIHAMSGGNAGYTLFTIPAKNGRACTLYSWQKEPEIFISGSVSEIQERVAVDFPLYGPPSAEAVQQLKMQRPSRAKTVKTNVYHDEAGRVMIIGDSAHSTGGTLGQGCNSALCDVVEFDNSLDQTSDNIEQAIRLYSERQVKEGLALWQLLQLPPRGLLSAFYLLEQASRGLINRLPLGVSVGPPVQTLLSQTLTPFSEIVSRNNFWVQVSLRTNK